MLRVSFILAAILAAEVVVLAHPIDYARRDEPPGIIPRAASDGVNPPQRSFMEDLYGEIIKSLMEGEHPHEETAQADAVDKLVHGGNQNWFGIRGYDVDGVERRGLSDLEGLETRGLAGEGKEKMERRELMGLMDGGELEARDFEILMPRRHKKKKKSKDSHGGGGGNNHESCGMEQIAKRDCHGGEGENQVSTKPENTSGPKDSENATKMHGHEPLAESQRHVISEPSTGSEENATNQVPGRGPQAETQDEGGNQPPVPKDDGKHQDDKSGASPWQKIVHDPDNQDAAKRIVKSVFNHLVPPPR